VNPVRLRVLLVEDAEPHVEAIRRAFARAALGVEVRVAASLHEYRMAVAVEIPDIALMDLNLPDGRSLDLLTSPPEDGLFPIVVMTSHGDEDTAVAALKAGALDYVVKTPEAFLDMPHTVDRVMREWRVRMERAEAIAQLRDREARYRAVTETATTGFFALDASGRVIDVNQAYIARSGFSREQLVMMHVSDLEAKESAEETARHLKQIVESGGGTFETQHRASDGTTWHVEIHASYWPIGGGLCFVFANDITARRSLEAQLRESQKLEAVGQLAGGVAHDYNNILAATVMTLGLLEERTDLSTEVRQAIGDLQGLADRSVKLTRQLLQFSRRSPLHVRTADLNRVLTDLHQMLRRLIGEHIEFEFAADPALPRIQADGGMIEQIATNLCVNARDAMPKGGSLSLRTSTIDIDPARARTHPDARVGRFACLSVSDSGVGMTPDVVGRIFEPFFTTKEKGKGTGLGLSTVFGIARQHNGWVEVESAAGVGSTFRVLLPADEAPCVDAADAAAEPVKGGHEVILLVEDELTVRNSISLVLIRHGYRVFQAGDGSEAQRVWRTCGARIDLLYTDMIMPGGMTGLDLARQLRTQQPDLKVVISSGYSDELTGPASQPNPEFLYLPKPVFSSSMLAAIRATLDGAQPGLGRVERPARG